MYRPIPIAALAAALTTPLAAQTERELEAHEHGAATLDIAIENDQLLVGFVSPWNNLVGFEHEPGNDEERAALEEARSRLEDPLSVIGLTADADCTLAGTETDDTMGSDEVIADAHDDEHDDEHSAEHGHEEEQGGEHSEISVSYTFDCGSIDALDAVDVTAGDTWDGIDDLDVRLIGPGGQSATELEGGSGRIDLSSVS